MRVAIYARRSTEDHQAASIATQVESATAWCVARGWEVAEVVTDEGISGSEFDLRPGLLRLPTLAVKAVVVRDLDRLGRDMLRVPLFIEKLASKGIAVWCYSTSARVEIDDPTQKFLATALAFARELEVRAIRARVREKLRLGAEKGHCVGGDVYGYRRVRTAEGVLYELHEAEAPVVRELFERRAKGASYAVLAHDLNRRSVASPRAGRRGTGSWDAGCVRDVLAHERYRGVLVWGRRGTHYVEGTRKEIERPEAERVVAVRPELAIVSDEVWHAVRALDQAAGARPKGRAPAYLLSTLARCTCGGPLQVTRMRWGSGESAVNVPAYTCGWAHRRGATVCTNRLRRPVDELDFCVVGWIEREVLSPAAVDELLARVRRAHEAPAPAVDEERERQRHALSRVDLEVSRLTRAITLTDDAPDSLVVALREAEGRRRALREALATRPDPAAQGAADWPTLERTIRARLGELRALFARQVAAGRAVLQAILRGPIVVRPVDVEGCRGRRFHLTAEAAFPGLGLVAGDVAPRLPVTLLASPEGTAESDVFLGVVRLSRIAGGRQAA